ncbi:MAG: MATE family efflux transporter [Pseudomonadota bacterium]
MTTVQGRFLTGSTMGHVVRMTAAGAFGITFVFAVDAANLVWLSQLGQPQLVAAIGFAYAIQFFSVSSGVGLMIAATALISRRIGEGDRAAARRQAGAALITSALIQAVVATLVFAFRHDLMALAGATGETARLAARYLAMTVFSLVPMAVGLLASSALKADGFAAKSMYITLWSGLFLMLIDPFLIFWLGLDGAAMGLVLFRFLLMALALYYAAVQEDLIARPNVTDILACLRPFMALSLPAIATQLATPAGNYLLTVVMAPFGDDAVAAWAVVSRLTVLAFGGIFALSSAIGGIFGQNYGAGYFPRLRSTYRDALIFCIGYTLVMWVLLLAATPLIVRAFDLSGQGAEVLRAFTAVGVGGFIFVGALFVANAAFNNLGQPLRATLVGWVKDGVLSFPAALWLSAGFGAAGVIYGQALAGALVGALAAYWGWRYVARLGPEHQIAPPAARTWPAVDRYRRR